MRRREFVTAVAAATAVAAQTPPAGIPQIAERKGRLKQGAMRVNFDPKMPFEDMCRTAASLGCKGMDLVGNKDWPTLRKYGLVPTMAGPGPVTIKDGLIRKELHDMIEAGMRTAIDDCAAAGCPNIITVGGQRRGMSDAEGADNAVAILNRLKGHAEEKNVTICMEIMNSKLTPDTLGRKDQMCDHVAWAADVCKRVNSPRVKILFDIYHVQIMDGDICRNIQQNYQWIAHFHTGGVPGRNEIDGTQEINYHFVAKTIADLGFAGYVSHEFRPAPGRDPVESLKQALEIMDV